MVINYTKITKQQEKFLKNKGIEVKMGDPSENEEYPYLTVGRNEKSSSIDDEFCFHEDSCCSMSSFGISYKIIKKAKVTEEQLTEIVESYAIIAQEHEHFNKEYKGVALKIFFRNPVYEKVAKRIEEKYSKN